MDLEFLFHNLRYGEVLAISVLASSVLKKFSCIYLCGHYTDGCCVYMFSPNPEKELSESLWKTISVKIIDKSWIFPPLIALI